LREVRALLPHEPLIYYADQGHLPYGPKPRETLRGYVLAIIRYLRERGCNGVVIACNSANAAALHAARAENPGFPIIGMEPAIKPAVERTRTGIIGVIATRTTAQGELFASVLDRFAQQVKVVTAVCPELVTLAEAGAPHTPEAYQLVADSVAPLKAAGIDQLVLACTHFPFLSPHLRATLGEGVGIIDPAPAVARQTLRVLTERGRLTASTLPGVTEYLTSGDPSVFRASIATLIGEVEARVNQCVLD
jgi:glutamate racemase